MLKILKKYEEQVNTNSEALLKAELPESTLVAKVVSNNNSLLIRSLKALFAEEKAQYLPATIVDEIKHLINDVSNLFENVGTDPTKVNQILETLQHMDKLYAYCLQCGLITFGFTGKEETLLVQNLRNKINDAEADVAQLKKEIAASKTKVSDELHNLEGKLSGVEKESIERINAKLNQFTNESDGLSGKLGEHAEGYKSEIEEKKKNAATLLNEIESQRETAKQAAESCTEHMAETTKTHDSANQKLSEISNAVSQANQQLVNATTFATDANTQLKNATQHAADAKAKDDAAAQHLANAKQRQQEIDAFYQEIETHKQEMREFKKQSEVAYNKLKSDCDSKVGEYTQRTEGVVTENQKLQDEIKVLLHKAVSAGLFGVFRKRQAFLTVTRFIMAGLVIVSVIALAVGIYRLASDLANIKEVGLNVAFFVRSGIMIPLIYLMYFAAAQYKKERQAEEEYAFKSAISFSLEPYRDLLIKTREDKELEADFVKKLMEDIFDNPVKRLYKHKDDKNELGEMMDVAKTLAGKLPREQKKAFLEIIQNAISAYVEK